MHTRIRRSLSTGSQAGPETGRLAYRSSMENGAGSDADGWLSRWRRFCRVGLCRQAECFSRSRTCEEVRWGLLLVSSCGVRSAARDRFLAERLDLDAVVVAAEFRAALRAFLRRSEVVARRSGLTPQRFLLLLMIKGASDRSERASIGDLIERLQLAQSSVTELVTRAEKVGLVEKQQSGPDRRVVSVRITEEGERRLTACFTALDPERRRLFEVLARVTEQARSRLDPPPDHDTVPEPE